MRRLILFMVCALFCAGSLSSCGYTTRSLLPAYATTVAVAPITNAIPLTDEITHKDHYRKYRHFLEVEITNAIIDRFIWDGTLRLADSAQADIMVHGALIDYRKDPLRYNDDEEVEEYRIVLTVDMEVTDTSTGEQLWAQQVTGDTTYFTTGALATTESAAVTYAANDLARSVIELTTEVW